MDADRLPSPSAAKERAADLASTFYYKSFEQCPDRTKHTPDPPGYIAWHEWAEKKAKTHEQRQCPTCGFWVIWKRKPKEAARGR